jgi:flavodoxin
VIVYFSRAGENYWYGGRRDLETGNTRVVAERIAGLVTADIIQIEASEAYPHDYEETVDRNRQEQAANARPEIAGGIPDLSSYDTIFLGCPVWSTRAPMIIRTLLDGNDLTGKTIHPFITYAVGPGSVILDYSALYPDTVLSSGLAIRGEEAAETSAAVEQWVDGNGLG